MDYYAADVITAVDAYSGGMEMPGRTLSSSLYRYSINGQERTPEIGANTTTAEFWQYDARIVRRWNVDPVVKEYESPYLAFSGNPILMADPNGDDGSPSKKNGLSDVETLNSETPKSNSLLPYYNPVSANGNWLRGALLFPGNTYVNANNAFSGAVNGTVNFVKKSNDIGLGPAVMNWIDGLGEGIKDWWSGTREYHAKTPLSRKLFDAKQWISNPDNVYNGAQQALFLYAAYRTMPSSTPAAVGETAAAEEMITLHRGVNSGAGKAYTNAQKGIVKPRGGPLGHSNPYIHNAVQGGTLNSKFSSWTPDWDVALNYALRKNGTGIVLTKQVPKSTIIKSPNTKMVQLIQYKSAAKVVSESEVLIKGPVFGCNACNVAIQNYLK